MIYILGEIGLNDYEDLEDVIVLASTKIDDVLEYLYKNVKTDYLYKYTIIIKPENDDAFYETIIPDVFTYDKFSKYVPTMYYDTNNLVEYEHIKNQLFIWCNSIRTKLQKEKEEREKIKAEQEEERERKLYEKLKAKYGD